VNWPAIAEREASASLVVVCACIVLACLPSGAAGADARPWFRVQLAPGQWAPLPPVARAHRHRPRAVVRVLGVSAHGGPRRHERHDARPIPWPMVKVLALAAR